MFIDSLTVLVDSLGLVVVVDSLGLVVVVDSLGIVVVVVDFLGLVVVPYYCYHHCSFSLLLDTDKLIPSGTSVRWKILICILLLWQHGVGRVCQHWIPSILH